MGVFRYKWKRDDAGLKLTDEKESKKPHQDHLVGFFL
jgi:hypothetical protein